MPQCVTRWPRPTRGWTAKLVLGLVGAGLIGVPDLCGAQDRLHPLARISELDTERLEAGRVTVLYSSHRGQDRSAVEASARRIAGEFVDAADFFAELLGGDVRFTLALLSPGDWHAVGGQYPIPWHSQADRLVAVPVRADLSLMLPAGSDSIRVRQVQEIVRLHQLGHVVTAIRFQPQGFRAPPPVRWFDELLASYLAHTYMRARRPKLADFAEELAREVVRGTEPRFSSLAQHDAYHDAYLSAPHGANNLGWYHNAFNLRAAELYDWHGPELLKRMRAELPWARIESWTGEELLELLERLSPGFLEWSEEMASFTRRRY